MNEKYRFLHCIGFLLLLATAAQSNKGITRCAEKGGFCVPKDLCDTGSEFLCDEENEVCCPYNPLSKTKRSPRDIEIPCQSTKECEFTYNGVCQSWCEDGRIPTGFCSRDCLCCGCPTTDKCREFSGYCTVDRCSCNGTIIPDWCIGEKCICCLPECLPSDECAANNGTCRKTCAEGEEPLPGAGCVDVVGESCTCCIPTCPNTTSCLDVDGYCTSNLDETCNGALLPDMCAGEKCSCCRPDCPGSDVCREAQGYCSHPNFCNGTIGPQLCPGDNCICCLPGCQEDTIACREANGYCTNPKTCDGMILPDLCLGENCDCCVTDCISDECEANDGYCTTRPDACFGRIIPEWCKGENCFCCLPVCHRTQPCIDNYGYCTIPENCYEKIVPEWCEGENCICCAPVCPPTQQCQEANGFCVSPDNCHGKYVPEWCDGEDCVCCIQELVTLLA